MSPQPRKRVTRTKRTGSNASLTSSIGGAALVLASVLPSALSPSPGGGASRTEPPSTISSTRAIKHTKGTPALAFQPGCELPFDAIKTDGLTIDAICSEDGNAGNDTGKRLESNAKNDFCVEGKPTTINYDDFKSLQAAADNIGGLKNLLKTSRDSLLGLLVSPGKPKIGEGSLVRFEALLLDAHFSNVGKGKGELVNCKLPDQEDNDIHIQLMKDSDDPCDSVTAEMSPHFRPEAWSALAGMKIERPVRLTGPLFFDSAHQPCREGKRPSPNRISVWEIHPIYQFEVCRNKTVAACDVAKDEQWIPLDQWHPADDGTEP